MITCKNCLQQYVGSATNFKNRFRIYKSDIKTNKDRCGTAKHFNGMYKNDNNIFQFLSVQFNQLGMPQTLKKFYGTEKNIGKASYLPRLMA